MASVRHGTPWTAAVATGSRSTATAGSTTGAALALPQHRPLPFETEGGQGAQDVVVGARHHARRIEVFNTHQPFPRCGAGVEVTGERRHQRAEMQGAAGRRRETAAIGRALRRNGVGCGHDGGQAGLGLTRQKRADYSAAMLQELEALETKLTQLLETHRALREENVRLRQQLVALENSNKLLSGRLDAARSRVENLFEQLPD